MEAYGNRYGSEVLAAATVGGAAAGLSDMGASTAIPNLPDKKFKAGPVTATVWKGVSPKGSVYYNVQIGRSYKDKDNNWKNTSSMRENDVPKALVLLQKAYEYVISQGTNSHLN